MNTNLPHETAKIYEFPRRVPKVAGGLRRDDKPAADLRFERVAEVEFGSGWYHEAAIEEAQRIIKP